MITEADDTVTRSSFFATLTKPGRGNKWRGEPSLGTAPFPESLDLGECSGLLDEIEQVSRLNINGGSRNGKRNIYFFDIYRGKKMYKQIFETCLNLVPIFE